MKDRILAGVWACLGGEGSDMVLDMMKVHHDESGIWVGECDCTYL